MNESGNEWTNGHFVHIYTMNAHQSSLGKADIWYSEYSVV